MTEKGKKSERKEEDDPVPGEFDERRNYEEGRR